MLPRSVDFLRIDINSGKVRKSVSVCQSDTVQRTLSFSLVNSGTPIDMTGLLFAEILINKANGYEADNGCVIDGNQIEYTLRSTDIQALGINICQLMLTFDTGEVITTPTFEIVVYQKVLDQRVQESTNEYNAIAEKLALVTEYATQVSNDKDAVAAYTETAEAASQSAEAAATTAVEAKDDVLEYKTQAESAAQSAATSANQAADIALAVAGLKDDVIGLKSDAVEAKGEALAAAVVAENNASVATTKASDASIYASNAADSADAAATSEANAKDYADAAAQSAEEASQVAHLELGETSDTAYRGDRGKAAYDHSQTTGNPHGTTYSQVGADAAGAAAQALLDAKSYADTSIATAIANLINGAPTALDTLKEIADALADNADVVAALNTAIGSKAAATDLTVLADRVTTLENKIGYPISRS